jgi:hypothetical protein
MWKPTAASCFVLMIVVLVSAVPALAQYSTVATPFVTVNDSFFENMGVGFGFNIPGWGLPFTQGGGVGSPFGGGGGGMGGGGGGGFFGFGMAGGGLNTFGNIGMSQGSSRSMVMETPMVTIPNGGQGTIIDAVQRPFVTGLIPVVGGGVAPVIMGGYGPGPGFGRPISPPVSPLFERIQRLNAQGALQRRANGQAPQRAPQQNNDRLALGGSGGDAANSTAEKGDLSVAEIRRRQQTEDTSADEELATWIERARGAEASGKRNVARIYYRMAAGRATGDLKQKLLVKQREMEDGQP